MEDLRPHAANATPLTSLGFLDRAATVYGDCLSIIHDDLTFTWSQTRSRCLRLASALVSTFSIAPGDVVSVVAPNIPAMYEMQFAIPMAGAVLNNLNIRLDARTLSILLRHSSSRLVFVDHEYIDLINHAFAIIRSDGHTPPPLIPILENDTTTDPNNIITTYEGLIRKGDLDFEWVRPASDWTPIVLNYTSGTTSAPKGVVHCHRGIFLVAVNSLLDWSVPDRPVYLWTLPMFHANGWTYPYGIAARGGVNVCLRRFDASAVFSAIRRHGVTHMCAAPVVLNMLANANSTIPHPVHVLTAGAPPPAAVLLRAESIGFRVSHGYGLTETCGLVVSCAWKPEWDRLPVEERAKFKARQGVRTLAAIDDVDVVETETGKSVRRDGNTLGEIVLRGGCVMLGYLDDVDATSKCLGKGGWFYTGDVGVIHPDGYVEVKDRSKDVIISGGENISSVEVESVLYTHPEVNEAAVVARADEFWGESPCAFVSVKAGAAATEAMIMEYCKGRLPRFMVPKTVVFKTELPKTSTGKIQKFVLREAAKALGPVQSGPVSRM